MLVTVKNVSGATINDLDAITGGVGVSAVNAVGGSRKVPLPFPFGHIGALANNASKQLPMHPHDWQYKFIPWVPMTPREEWNDLIQRKIVTFTIANQPGRKDVQELFMNMV